jgi:hypothetical protein
LTTATFWADTKGAATSRAAAITADRENFMKASKGNKQKKRPKKNAHQG